MEEIRSHGVAIAAGSIWPHTENATIFCAWFRTGMERCVACREHQTA
jgi:hypothetical protein